MSVAQGLLVLPDIKQAARSQRTKRLEQSNNCTYHPALGENSVSAVHVQRALPFAANCLGDYEIAQYFYLNLLG